jgi:surfeit locus 1 family protein
LNQGAALQWRRILLPSFLAMPVLAVLLALGIWQVQRLGWKSALLADLAVAQSGPPGPATNPAPFSHIIATGRFLHDREVLLGSEVRGTTLGAALITPLERDGLPALLVERGWVPLDRAGVTRPEGPVTVQGYMRPSERPGLLSATDATAQRRFHNFDVPAIGAALGLPVAPFGLAVVVPGRPRPDGGLGSTPAPNTGGVPSPATSFPSPNNPHLGYAITWFGLAAAWTGIFALWAHRRIRMP